VEKEFETSEGKFSAGDITVGEDGACLSHAQRMLSLPNTVWLLWCGDATPRVEAGCGADGCMGVCVRVCVVVRGFAWLHAWLRAEFPCVRAYIRSCGRACVPTCSTARVRCCMRGCVIAPVSCVRASCGRAAHRGCR
jgi:hypothetical protein